MQTIRCAKCKQKIFKYKKIGKGKLLRCWYEKIIEDYSIRDGNTIKCACGNVIGSADHKKVKMRYNSFERSGSISRK